jgi:hypothetical protein
MDAPSEQLHPAPRAGGSFFDRWDMILAGLAELLILSASAAACLLINSSIAMDLFAWLAAFWIISMGWAILALKIIRTAVPIQPGTYSYAKRSATTYAWTLSSFLYSVNLGLLYNNPSWMPSPMKKVFYQMLGAKIGKGPLMLGGKLTDPFLITIEEGVVIGGAVWLLPHAMASFDSKVLILGRIVLKKDAIIGAATLIMPNVIVH